jgi:hypothetical protein
MYDMKIFGRNNLWLTAGIAERRLARRQFLPKLRAGQKNDAFGGIHSGSGMTQNRQGSINLRVSLDTLPRPFSRQRIRRSHVPHQPGNSALYFQYRVSNRVFHRAGNFLCCILAPRLRL